MEVERTLKKFEEEEEEVLTELAGVRSDFDEKLSEIVED